MLVDIGIRIWWFAPCKREGVSRDENPTSEHHGHTSKNAMDDYTPILTTFRYTVDTVTAHSVDSTENTQR